MIILKYILPYSNGLATITMPENAKVLCVANQFEELKLWAEVPDDDVPKFPRNFYVAFAGRPIDDALKLSYIGTALIANGEHVVHVYEEVR